MDFNVIRPKPPPKGSKPSPPAPEQPPAPPNGAGPPPPQFPPSMRPPYVEEIDTLSRMQRLRSIEYTNARTWKVNFGDHDQPYYYNQNGHNNNYRGYTQQTIHHNHHQGPFGYDHGMLPPPPPPPTHIAMEGPPPRMALPPPPEYHYQGGPWQQTPNPQPYYGGMFSDENPNACAIM